MHTGQQTDLGGQRADLVDAAAIDALAVLQQPGADDLLLQLVADEVEIGGGQLGVLGGDGIHNGQHRGVADVLVVGVHRGLNVLEVVGVNVSQQGVVKLHGGEALFRLADLGDDAVDERQHLPDLLVTDADGLHHGLLVDLVGTGLDHDDLFLAGGKGQGEVAVLALLLRGVQHDLAVHQTDKHTGNRAVPGNIRHGDGQGRTVHAGNFGRAVGVLAQDVYKRQVLTICTLGSTKDAQLMDDLSDTPYKRYIHHYNFPPYSVGEARAPRSPGRREIGHGNLAERALIPVLPDQAEFPYTIRCVSEVLSSNGSTSQASICGSTLALMDAGVPIKAPVAGISCGLITDGDPLHGGRWMTMLDIQGVEDFHGDMDFKVGGTRRGITAIQMDIKVDGLTYEIVEEALEKCRKGRLYILDEIIKPVIAEPRAELSKYAPKMFSMMIPVDKIKDVIGKGGKVIQEMCANFNCKIDIEEDGHVFISAVDQDDAKRAIATIKTIVEDPEIGAIYKGRVTRLMNFGAFVEIAPGKEGLVHISKLDDHRVEHVEDVVAVGDPIFVMVTDIDQQGRINLSRKDAIAAIAKKRAEAAQQ